MKREVRVLGIDDAPHTREDDQVLLVATLFRGGSFMDGVLSTHITRDGCDASERIIEMVARSKFSTTIRTIFLDGIAVGGLNVIDAHKVNTQLKIPFIIVSRPSPRPGRIVETLRGLGMEEKIPLIERLDEPRRVNDICIQPVGISMTEAIKLLTICCTHSHIPEALRTAHLIAGGVVDGESRGGA